MGKSGKRESPRKTRGIVLFVLLSITALTFVVISFMQPGRMLEKLDDNYVAVINGEKIYVSEFKYFVVIEKGKLLPQLLKGNKSFTDEIWLEAVGGRKAFEVVKERSMENVVKFKVQLIKAGEKGISLNSSEIKQVEDGMKMVKKRGDDVTRKYFYKIYGLSSENEYLFIKQEERLVEKFRKSIFDEFGENSKYEKLVEEWKSSCKVEYDKKTYDSVDIKALGKVY